MSIEELAKLSDEELRVRCAELDGWRESVRRTFNDNIAWEKGGTIACIHRSQLDFHAGFEYLPDYPADLNACHEVVRTLTETQRGRFVSILCSMSGTAEYDAFEWAICDAEARHITIALIAVKQQPVEVKGGVE